MRLDLIKKIARLRAELVLLAFSYRLDSPLLTSEEMKEISEHLWNRPWPSYEEADRTSIYTRVWNLLEKKKT